MHTKQWLNKQGTWPNKGLLGCGEHGCLGLFERHEYEVVGSSNRSILQLGKRAESYKHDICPPYLLRRRFRRCSRSQLASSPRVTAEHTRSKHWKGNQRRCIYYYEASISKKDQEATRDNALRYRIYRRERLLTG